MIPPPDEADFIRRLAEADEALRAGSSHPPAGDADSPFAAAVRVLASLHAALAAPPSTPSRIGRFRILHRLGEGGFGVVFLAADEALNRQVALKIPHPGRLYAPSARQRFLREARAAASLDHPNVIPLLETGEADGVCYQASVYCPGPSLERWLQEHPGPVPWRDAVAFCLRLAEAVRYAHSRGVVHRDLKPANVLLAAAGEGDPSRDPDSLRDAQPRVTDFGLALLLREDVSLTRTGEVVGTPEYLAPELAEGDPAAAGPPADLWALGVILYRLLSGVLPFVGRSVHEVLRKIETFDESALTSFAAAPRDVRAACLMCLARQPARRYPDAAALCDDLGRLLQGVPVRARMAGPAERLVRWCIRRPVRALSLAFLTLAITSAALATWFHIARLGQVNKHITALAEDLEEELYASNLQEAGRLVQAGDRYGAQAILSRYQSGTDGAGRRDFAWHLLSRQTRGAVPTCVSLPDKFGTQLVVGRDSRSLFALHPAEALGCWDLSTGLPRSDATGGDGRPVPAASISPSGRFVLRADQDTGQLRVIRTADGEAIASRASGPWHRSVWSADEKRIYLLGTGRVACWEPAAGRLRDLFRVRLPLESDRWALGNFRHLPVRTRLVLIEATNTFGVWDVTTGKRVGGLPWGTGTFSRVGELPDGRLVVIGGRLLAVCAPDGSLIRSVAVAVNVDDLAISPDGKSLAVASMGGDVLTFDTTTWVRRPLPPRSSGVLALAYAAGGRELFTYGRDGLIAGMPVGEDLAFHDLVPPGAVDQVAFSPDGRYTAVTSRAGAVHLLHQGRERPLETPRSHVGAFRDLTFSPDGKRLVATGEDEGHILVWDVPAAKLLGAFAAGGARRLASAAVAPNGKWLFAADAASGLHLLAAEDGRRLRSWARPAEFERASRVRLSCDGRMLAVSDRHGRVAVYRVTETSGTGSSTVSLAEVARTRLGDVASECLLLWHPAVPNRLCTSYARYLHLWDVGTGSPARPGALVGTAHLAWPSWTPDGEGVVTFDSRHVRARNLRTRRTRWSVQPVEPWGQESLSGGLLAPGGSVLAVTTRDRSLLFVRPDGWSVRPAAGRWAPVPRSLALSADGRTLYTAARLPELVSFASGPMWGLLKMGGFTVRPGSTDSLIAWDLGKRSPRPAWNGEPVFRPPDRVRLNPKGDLAACPAPDGSVWIRKTATGAATARLLVNPDDKKFLLAVEGARALGFPALPEFFDPVLDAAFSPDGERLVILSRKGRLAVHRTKDWGEEARREVPPAGRGGQGWLAFRPGGEEVVVCTDGNVGLYAVRGLGLLRTLSGPDGPGSEAGAVSPCGGFLASAHQDGSLRIVKLPGGDEVRVIREQGSALTAVAFHPAGRTLAAGGLDGAVRFYRVGNGRRTVTLTAPGPAGSLLFDAAGNTLFVGTTDAMGRGCVRVWKAGEPEGP